MGEFLSIGDYVALYCEDSGGYIYSVNTSSVYNNISVYHKQDLKKPGNLPDPQVILFEICIQNRYKLNKKYKKLYGKHGVEATDAEYRVHSTQAKAAADAENVDNLAEQRRNQGKKVRYGEVIQLRHVFGGKYIHVNTTQTSQRDKNNMMLSLHAFNAKSAQFRLLPRYKVKSEGEHVQIFDQITFESIKSAGHYFHASNPDHLDNFSFGSELNLGVEQSGFTIVKSHSYLRENENTVRGGQFVQLFHKEMEAYLVAEGLFSDEIVTEEVHLRIREIDQLNARTLRPSTSAITYWQVESEKTILNGEPFSWEQQFRFRHATTRLYLTVTPNREVTLTRDPSDPNTVFKLHPVIQDQEEVLYESYARIEHVMTGSWLHALKDQEYHRQQFSETEDEMSMKALRWDGGSLRKISCVQERRYDDAFTIQQVQPEYVAHFNYVAGCVPFIKNLIENFKRSRPLYSKEVLRWCTALREMRNFILENNPKQMKSRQKLLRNLRLVDLIVDFLKLPTGGSTSNEVNVAKIHQECYDILYAYMVGNSRKNALYFAKYIEIFQEKMCDKTDLGLQVARMIVELIRDNRKIVDRISKHQIDDFVKVLRQNQNHRYLELLEVLVVCNKVAIPENQTYVARKWLIEDISDTVGELDNNMVLLNFKRKRGVFHTDRGQNIYREPGVIYVSTDGRRTWTALHDFLNSDAESSIRFLEKQLDLFIALCYGRNEECIRLITKELNYLSWDEAFVSLQSEILPEDIRAKYCQLIMGLFVDVGNNYSVVDFPELCFIYEYIDVPNPATKRSALPDHYNFYQDTSCHEAAKDFITKFPVLRDWISKFLDENICMLADMTKHNMLIEQVLRLVHYLVKFGYYGDVNDIQKLISPLTNLLDGRHDLPFQYDPKSREYSKETKKLVHRFKQSERYEETSENTPLVSAKYAALEILDIFLTFEANARLAGLISKFKQCEQVEGNNTKKKYQSSLTPALYDDYDPLGKKRTDHKRQNKQMKELKQTFQLTSHIDVEALTHILLDLAHYKYDCMVQMSLRMLNRFFSSYGNAFNSADTCLVLTTDKSCEVHHQVARQIPLLRLMAKTKWSEAQVERMEAILTQLIDFCYIENTQEPHPMNQKILFSHNIIYVLLEILEAETDVQLAKTYSQIEKVLRKAVQLIKAVTMRHPEAQNLIFDNMDNLLQLKLVESDLALALREVFINNQNICLKILPRQIQKIVTLIADHQDKAPEFLRLLSVIVKVEGPDLALKRNQTLVVKYIMQNYSRVAYILEEDKGSDIRVRVLLGEFGSSERQYLVSLVDLLATCAEGENRYIESLCQTILTVEDILDVLIHRDIAPNIKCSYLRYLLYAYMKITSAWSENGAADLLKDKHSKKMLEFIEAISDETYEVSDWLEKVLGEETIIKLLRKPFPKCIEDHDICPICDNPQVLRKDEKLIENLDNDELADGTNAETELNEADEEDIAIAIKTHGFMNYLFDSILPFAQVYAVVFSNDEDDMESPEQIAFDKFTRMLAIICEKITPYLVNPAQLKAIIGCLTMLTQKSKHIAPFLIEKVVENIGKGQLSTDDEIIQAKMKNKQYYEAEIQLNCKLKMFARHCHKLYGGHNTVTAQLKIKSKREYTCIERDDALPLGEEFQSHLRCFIVPNLRKTEQRFKLSQLLVDQLNISSKTSEFRNALYGPTYGSKQRKEQVALDIRCLQLLRAMIHNEERRLPEDWEIRTSEMSIRKGLKVIQEIQNTLNKTGLCTKILPHLANPNEIIIREVLCLQSCMLFNANTSVQQALLDYFLKTKEEVFFYAVKTRMQMSTANIKERRLLHAQQRARKEGESEHAKNLTSTMTLGNKALKAIRYYEVQEKLLAQMTSLQTRIISPPKKGSTGLRFRKHGVNGRATHSYHSDQFLIDEDPDHKRDEIELSTIRIDMSDPDQLDDVDSKEDPQEKPLVEDEISQKDDGHVELVLKLLARICDGQHMELQNYLRVQPDNIKSFNLVAEVATFLDVVYSNINKDNIELVTQIFTTLNEFIAGSQENRTSVYDSKIIDYINYILRSGEFEGCKKEEIIQLRMTISNVIISLIEENNREAYALSMDVKDTLDKEAVYQIMTECYESHEKGEADKHLKKSLFDVGFSYFLILVRLSDLDPNLNKKEITPSDEQMKAFKFYKKNSCSVEIVKNDFLQKITFRVKQREVLREEIKEKLKWTIDRSSPSNKIRDFMDWSKAILEDIRYQRYLMKNPLNTLFTKMWPVWNYTVTILTVIINIILLIGLKAPPGGSFGGPDSIDKKGDIPVNFTYAHERYELKNSDDIWKAEYHHVKEPLRILCIIHSVLASIILLTYLISDHPSPPDIKKWGYLIKNKLCKSKKIKYVEDDGVEQDVTSSKMTASLISFKTFYYMTFLGMSLAGCLYSNFFFAFHLFNIIHNNQLLQGVISAVTQNGKSLIWVGILGIILIYLYAIIGFSLFQDGFDSESFMYCTRLSHCFVTVLRFGLVGDLFENMVPGDDKHNGFDRFSIMVIYHISFFIIITTIGLNIIFGIIVDTFSELRDLRWSAESDMRDVCFICSRNSYDFEHYGMGFDFHVQQEHNMWSYIFFFIHLQDTKPNDYTSLELHVHKLLIEEHYDFFPLSRALCLSAKDDKSTDSKIDELLDNVEDLVRRQKEDDAEKKKFEELLRQRRWQRQYRNGTGHDDQGNGHDDDDDNDDGDDFDVFPVSKGMRRQSSYRLPMSSDESDIEDRRRKPSVSSATGRRPRVESEQSVDSDYGINDSQNVLRRSRTHHTFLQVPSPTGAQRQQLIADRPVSPRLARSPSYTPSADRLTPTYPGPSENFPNPRASRSSSVRSSRPPSPVLDDTPAVHESSSVSPSTPPVINSSDEEVPLNFLDDEDPDYSVFSA